MKKIYTKVKLTFTKNDIPTLPFDIKYLSDILKINGNKVIQKGLFIPFYLLLDER